MLERQQRPQSPLSPEQKIRIYGVIFERMTPDDRYPQEVIQDVYKGDENAYLQTMATLHAVPVKRMSG